MMNEEELLRLTGRIVDRTATEEEIERYNQWCDRFRLQDVAVPEMESIKAKILVDIHAHIDSKPIIKRFYLKRIAIAASILLVLGAGMLFFNNSRKQVAISSVSYTADVLPGANKAVLILSNGKKVSLTDVANGKVAHQAGINIVKTADGTLVYQVSGTNEPASAVSYNTIETPRGGQYMVYLPDGSKVIMNALSSLTFPTTFNRLQHRKVELSGEAYFEVTKDKSRPFIVKTAIQEIEVLGTHFNINSYADEQFTKTTLAEGIVRVKSSMGSAVLKPGQQASVTKRQGRVIVSEVDLEEVMAWKNGYFMFVNEDINSVMKKISRWYDVDIVYESDVSGKTIWGNISKFRNISQVLNMLEMTGVVKFKIEGRRVIVKS